MQSTYIKNFTAANGIFEITVPDFNKVNPSASENSITEANLNIAVNASASFSANIFALPEAEVTPPCETCHFLFEKTFSAGENTFTANLLDLTKSKMNGGGTIFVKIIPKTAASFSASASFTVKLTADRECDFVNRELNTDAYQTFDIGSIGTASVNLRDGSLNFSRNDWSFGGGATAFNLMHIYKGASYDSDEIFSDIHTQAGKGWKTNFHQYLAGNNQNASYVDASGKAHFFDISNGKIYDTSGLGLFLGTVASCKKLSDVNGNEMHFSPQGKLCCINSALGNDLFIGYEASGLNNSSNVNASDIGDSLANTRIAYIQNGNYKATFSYQNDLLSSISYTGSEHSADEVLKFTYIDGRLTKIHKEAQVDGSTVESIQAQFGYLNGRLTKIFGDDYKELNMTYDELGRVIKVARLADAVMFTSFAYNNDNTVVTDELGAKKKYNFKNDGEIESIFNITDNSNEELYSQESATSSLANSEILIVKEKTGTEVQDTEYSVKAISGISIDGILTAFGANEFTTNDLRKTLGNAAKSRNSFDIIYCNGKKRICNVAASKCSFKIDTVNSNFINLNMIQPAEQGQDKIVSLIYRTKLIDDSSQDKGAGNQFRACIDVEETFLPNYIESVTSVKDLLSNKTYGSYGKIVRTNYDGTVKYVLENNVVTEYTYDSFGNLTETKVSKYNASASDKSLVMSSSYDVQTGHKNFETDANGFITRYEYLMPHNIVNKVFSPTGNITYIYDNFKEKIVNVNDTALTYNKGNIESISQGNAEYEFGYSALGDLTSVKINDEQIFASSVINSGSGKTITKTFGNSSQTTTFDKYGRMTAVSVGDKSASISYVNGTSKPQISKIIDDLAGTKKTYSTDEFKEEVFNCTGKLVWKKKSFVKDGKAYRGYAINNEAAGIMYFKNQFDRDGKTVNVTYVSPNHNGDVSNSNMEANNIVLQREVDDINRLKKTYCSSPVGIFSNRSSLQKTYQYLIKNGVETNLVSKEITNHTPFNDVGQGIEVVREYEYDTAGNITKVSSNGVELISYTYENGRLKTESNGLTGQSITYNYDSYGNITAKNVTGTNSGNNSFEYHQNNPYLLKKHTFGSTIIDDNVSYNEGCPSKINGKNVSWERGLLKQFSNTEIIHGINTTETTDTYKFDYDLYGKRTFRETSTVIRTNGNVISNNVSENRCYYYDGDKLIAERCYNVRQDTVQELYMIHYIYDEIGVCAVKLYRPDFEDDDTFMKDGNNFVVFSFDRDIFGSVVGIYGDSGRVLAINYDAYGKPHYPKTLEGTNISSSTLFRIGYKGYYYDAESGLYYTGKEYYNPETGRYLAMRDMSNLSFEKDGLNLFAYCANRPLNVKEAKAVISPTDYLFNNTQISVGQALFVGAAVIGNILDFTNASFDFVEILKKIEYKSFTIALSLTNFFISFFSDVAETGDFLYSLEKNAKVFFLSEGISFLIIKLGSIVGGLPGAIITVILIIIISLVLEDLLEDLA